MPFLFFSVFNMKILTDEVAYLLESFFKLGKHCLDLANTCNLKHIRKSYQ